MQFIDYSIHLVQVYLVFDWIIKHIELECIVTLSKHIASAVEL